MIIAQLTPEGAEQKRQIIAKAMESKRDSLEWCMELFALLTTFLVWHPDDSFDEYTTLGTDDRIFNDEEACLCNFAMARAMSICGRMYEDPYTLPAAMAQTRGS